MVLFTSRARCAAFLSIALGAFAVAASAQQGRFTLPYETHWGNAVLQPGEYTLKPMDTSAWPRVLIVRGQDHTVYILASVDKFVDSSEGSYLRIDDVGGVKVVRELHSSMIGKSFVFAVPKHLRAQMASRATPDQTTKVALFPQH